MNKIQLSSGIFLLVLAVATYLVGSDVIVYPLGAGQITIYLSVALAVTSLVLLGTVRKRWN
ncbi:MAG TPA: hypothetical protein VLA49_19215 [Anaerolineales bacterium]|nr:hypothetical protein [Anaerolineales bacterium]